MRLVSPNNILGTRKLESWEMLLTIEWKLKTPIYISQERSSNLLMGCWWWDLGREDEESDCQYWQWCQCAAVMEQSWGSSCWPIVSPSPPRPGHDGCHPLGGAQWPVQNTALKRNISWSNSNPGIIDVGIELDCVIIWVTQLLTRDCSLSSFCTCSHSPPKYCTEICS